MEVDPEVERCRFRSGEIKDKNVNSAKFKVRIQNLNKNDNVEFLWLSNQEVELKLNTVSLHKFSLPRPIKNELEIIRKDEKTGFIKVKLVKENPESWVELLKSGCK